MFERQTESDQELLKRLCDKHELEIELVMSLLKVERDFQYSERRHGLLEKLRSYILESKHHTRT